MNRLRNLLKSEKLSLSQYFEEAYKLFNEMIRDDNKDIMIIMFLNFINIKKYKEGGKNEDKV